MRSSNSWRLYFQNNLTNERVNWNQLPKITQQEKKEILYSLKAWQLGETSEGKNLLAATRKYAEQYSDPEYLEAMKLFIKEEQKHGSNLGVYVDLIGEDRLEKDLGDSLFRKIRGMNKNMEAWTITVIIVESAAQLFYQALKDATQCSLLKEICTDILIDEAQHIKFQLERLQIIYDRKGLVFKLTSNFIYRTLFHCTCLAIWTAHHRAFEAGGIDRAKFFSRMNHKFDKVRRVIDPSVDWALLKT